MKKEIDKRENFRIEISSETWENSMRVPVDIPHVYTYTAYFASGTVMQPFGASEKEQPVSFVSTMSSGAVVIAAVIARDIRPGPGFAVARCKDCIFSWKPDESRHESESARASTHSYPLLFSSLLFELVIHTATFRYRK